MPWKESSILDQRREFIAFASQPGATISLLAQRYGISRKTAHKWVKRYQRHGLDGLEDQSRRPHTFRCSTPDPMVAAVLSVRERYPCWGGRKIRRVLENERQSGALLVSNEIPIPAACTITRILQRHGKIAEDASAARIPVKRFARAAPNELWQMDFKSDVALTNRRVSYPLTILDDYCRFNLCLQACENQRHDTVVTALTAVFRRYGLPLAMLMDNGVPWAHSAGALTRIELWLLRLGVRVLHGRAYHPQTQGKEERFHRTLKTEVLNGRLFPHAGALQEAFDRWRYVYNHVRPHEAIDLDTPESRYSLSERPFPEQLPSIHYDQSETVRRVRETGYITVRNRTWYLSEALGGQDVAIRPHRNDGVYLVCLGPFAIGLIDDRHPTTDMRMKRYRSIKELNDNEHPEMQDVMEP